MRPEPTQRVSTRGEPAQGPLKTGLDDDHHVWNQHANSLNECKKFIKFFLHLTRTRSFEAVIVASLKSQWVGFKWI